MTTLTTSQIGIPASAFEQVARNGERVRIEGANGEAIYLVSEQDMLALEVIEDRYWAEEGKKALERFRASGEKAIPWESVKNDLRLT